MFYEECLGVHRRTENWNFPGVERITQLMSWSLLSHKCCVVADRFVLTLALISIPPGCESMEKGSYKFPYL